jgi:SP family galactose:H+ symporter-like MFS transporter
VAAGNFNLSNSKNNSNGEYKKIVYWVCTIAALGGLLFGLDIGFIGASLETIEKIYHLGVEGGEKYAAVLATGGVVGALLSGLFARFLGRKRSLVFAGFLFSALSIWSAMLPSIEVLTYCRFGLGFAVGVSSFIVPLYLSETAPAGIRGSMGTLFQLMITIGIFLIAAINTYIAHAFTNPNESLPMMFLVVAVFSLVMFFGCFVLPESPRWLMLKGRREQAEKVLVKVLNTNEEIQEELNEIEQAIKSDKGAGVGIIFKGYFFKVLLMGVLLQMFQQLVGINMMIYYAPKIFGYAGITGLVAALTVPTVNMLFTFPAIRLVEKWGRKKLLYVGSVVMFVTMVAAGLTFASIGGITDPSQIGTLPKAVLLISVIVYIFGFAVSWGPVAWLVCSEVFPLEGREVGMTITTMVNWTFAGLVMSNALTFMNHYGNHSIFYVFAGFCLLSMVFLKLFVPETRGTTLEHIEENLKKGLPLRDIGNK